MNDTTAWTLNVDAEGIAQLVLDKPGTSANVLSRDVLLELDALLARLQKNPPRGLILRSAKKSGFVAGADVKEFTSLKTEADAFELIRAGQLAIGGLAALPCPTVAAVHGFALGGGLELALACRYRIGVDDERLSLGLPEVQLGIQPGFGGTVRTVQLIGVRPAMQLMLTGKPVRAKQALKLGLVDALVPASKLEATARRFILNPPTPRAAPLVERVLNLAPMRPFVKSMLIKQVARKARREHYPAPYAMIDLWARYGAQGNAAYEAEARSIARLFFTSTARNLIRVFLLQDRLKSLGGKSALEFKHVHVVGAGVMGGDIAAWCALRGFTVTLQDREQKFIEPALQRAADLFEKKLREPVKVAAARERLRADVAGDGVAQADVVIEAIFENLEAKRELYAKLEPQLKPQALLATNTSSLMLEPLSAQLTRPGRLVGLHFFNPVAQMPLIEIVQSQHSEPEAISGALAFTRKLDKLPVACRSAPGFIVNRVLMPYLHEAMYAAQEGVPLAAIDEAAVAFGMPMGPIELADVVGLDVAAHVGDIVASELGRAAPELTRLRELIAAKKLGRKSGAGFYLWQEGKPVKTPASEQAPADLTDRLILVLVNECVALLRERVVEEADLIDAAVIFGTGFAPFRGGPLTYARERGITEVMARLKELAARYGARFVPDPGWAQLQSLSSNLGGS